MYLILLRTFLNIYKLAICRGDLWRILSSQRASGAKWFGCVRIWAPPHSSLCLTLPAPYHGEASYFPNSHVELPQVQRLLAHSGKLTNRCAPLLHEVQVSLHPASPLRLSTELVQPCDSVAAEGRGVRVGFLEMHISRGEKYLIKLWIWICDILFEYKMYKSTTSGSFSAFSCRCIM